MKSGRRSIETRQDLIRALSLVRGRDMAAKVGNATDAELRQEIENQFSKIAAQVA